MSRCPGAVRHYLRAVSGDPRELGILFVAPSTYSPLRCDCGRAREVGRMRVLILTRHFAPEVTAGRFRVEAFADGLVRRGHEGQVICPVPNHPRGVIEDEYRRPWLVDIRARWHLRERQAEPLAELSESLADRS